MTAKGSGTEPGKDILNVLIADDDALSFEFLHDALSMENIDAVWAADGQEAMNLMESRPFDILLLDVHMPRLDGFNVLRNLRQGRTGRAREMKVIVISASAMPGERESMLNAGADAFVPKPVLLPELVKTINDLVGPKAGAGRQDS